MRSRPLPVKSFRAKKLTRSPRWRISAANRVWPLRKTAQGTKFWETRMCAGLEPGEQLEQRSNGSVQRRRDRHSHHDHGAGAPHAVGCHLAGVAAGAPRLSRIRTELRLSLHLLGEPPS